jgi:penicillin-binding protein 1A
MSTWLGNPDTSVLRNGNSSIPAQIIGDVMEYAHKQVYAKEKKWKAGDWFTKPKGIQTIGNELYPSWYNKSFQQAKKKVTFDRVSKKKATECTPEEAKIIVEVIEATDPITKKKSLQITNGYDPSKEDDAHKCSDRKPTVSVSISSDGKNITVNYTSGRYVIEKITLTVNGRPFKTLSASGSGSQTIPYTSSNSSFTVNAAVIDKGYYSASSSDSWEEDSDD